MKTFITATALTLATLSSFAQEATPAPEFDNFVSTRSRAEVRAELKAALASGWLPAHGEASDAPAMHNPASTRSRADVKAELQAAIAGGWQPLLGEASTEPGLLGSDSPHARTGAMAARSEVVVR